MASQRGDKQQLHKVLRSTAWLISGRVLRLALGVCVYVLVARYLRPAEFGLLVSALALASILEIAGRLGLNQVVLRDMVRNPGSTGELLSTLLGLRFICALVGLAVAFTFGFAAFASLDSSWWVFPVVGLSLLPASLSNTLTLWFQARTEARTPVLMDTLSFVVGNSLRVILLATGGSLLGFSLIPLLAKSACCVGFVLVVRRRDLQDIVASPRLKLAGTLLKDNWPLVFGQLAGVVYLKVDQVMLAAMAGPSQAGIYGAALRISEVWYFVPAALCISLKPTLTRLRERNHERYLQVLQSLFSTMTFIVLSVAIPMSFFAPTIVELLFGGHYSAAAPVLVVHIWTALFVFWKRAQSEWVINEGHLKFGLARSLLGASSNIILNLVLIPIYGAPGAAVATLVSAFISVVPTNLMFSPARPILGFQLKSLLLAGLPESARRWLLPTFKVQNN